MGTDPKWTAEDWEKVQVIYYLFIFNCLVVSILDFEWSGA